MTRNQLSRPISPALRRRAQPAQIVLAAALCLAAAAESLGSGRIVAAHDEWTLSNTGFGAPSDPGVFALNVVQYLTGRQSASILVYSSNFGLTQSNFLGTLTGAGHAVTVSTATPFTLTNLLNFDAVFVTGIDFNDQVLIDYVEAGRGVYICGGTGNSTDTANNAFMNHFGLQFNGLNGICCHLPIASGHPIFAGVDHLFQNNGSTITLVGAGGGAEILVTNTNGAGLYAVYDATPCPLPTPDLSGDGQVGGADLGILLAAWGVCIEPCCPADLNGDGVVDGGDLGLLLSAWTA